ncbi:MAG: ATP-binding protein [Marinilabiliaceae bacterium]|nr:ATP-binding protein [Marinilabiliaceae bacterium]
MSLIFRQIEKSIKKDTEEWPIVAILGPRQCGKSTLSKQLLSEYDNTIYIDLELPSDLAKLDDAEWFLRSQKGKLICIDEIQRKPELFPLLRSLVDENDGDSHIIILGSASRDLIKQSSESLAGRVVYHSLTPFLYNEVNDISSISEYIFKGGFPRSLLGSNDFSIKWRKSFIETYLERDLKFWRNFVPTTMRRLWIMLANNNGQLLNCSTMAKALDMSSVTIRHYIDLLTETYMVIQVEPYMANTNKRITKSPKVYIADSGITATLLSLNSFESVYHHQVFGSIWEQIVLTTIKGNFPDVAVYFYRTVAGSEMDFVLEYGDTIICIECKSSSSPILHRGTYESIKDIKPTHTLVVAMVEKGWEYKPEITVVSLLEMIERLRAYF